MNRRDILKSSLVATLAGTAGIAAASTARAAEGDSNVIKPRRLQKGDTVGVIAPASSAFEDEEIRFAIDIVDSLGYRVKEGKHLYARDKFLAGTDRDRADDVNRMFADDGVDAIFALRGGYGTSRILPYLDYDVIANNPKVFIGYSDITAILNAIHAKTGLTVFHGPVAKQNFSDYTLAEFRKVLVDPAPHTRIGEAPPIETREGFVDAKNRVTRFKGGKAEGRLVGGNLTLIANLMGTPFEPDFRGKILFIEDVGEAPYRVDRMLTQLWLAGRLQETAGLAFGKITGAYDTCNDFSGNTFSIEEVIRMRCEPLGVPTIRGLMIGHVEDQTTVPLGVNARLDADAGTLELLEPAVT